MDDFNLIKRCVTGDKKSWNEFVDKFTRLIYDSILRTFREFGCETYREVLDDLHNDVFVSLLEHQYRSLRIFKGHNGCKLAHYIRTISVRKTIDYLRKLRDTSSLDEGNKNGQRDISQFLKELVVSDSYEVLEEKEAVQIVEMLLSELKERERRLCQMFFIDREEPEYIAEQLGISIQNFYVSKQRVLKKLKEIAVHKKVC